MESKQFVEQTLFETNNYRIDIGPSKFTDVTDNMYLIVNKTTNVVEAEHRVLGYAKTWCKQFEELLSDFEAKESGFSKIPGPSAPESKL